MSDQQRQHGNLMFLEGPTSLGMPLVRIPLGAPPFREERLQSLLATHPEMLPIWEIEPAFVPITFLGREVPTRSGEIDLVYVSPKGYLTLVETKLWDNPGARREVVAQIIDYATEISTWDFEELDDAVQKSSTANGQNRAPDIFTAMRGTVGDFDEVEFVDGVTRNLARGRFLLLIAGNGIREGVEKMASFLQASPGMHYSLALVELCLYKMHHEHEYPIILQPRTIASTVQIVRAVVSVEAPENLTVNVTLQEDIGDKRSAHSRSRRRKLTEEIFFEELAENTSEETAQRVESLIQSLGDLGIEPTWRSASVSMRLPDPGVSGANFTVILLTPEGKFYLGWLSQAAIVGGYDPSIAEEYLKRVVEITGISRVFDDATDHADISLLLDSEIEFSECVRTFVARLRQAADDGI